MKFSVTLKACALALVVLAAQGCGPMLYRMTNGMIGDPGEVVVDEFDFSAASSSPAKVAGDYFDETHADSMDSEIRLVIPTVRFLFNTRQGAAASAQGSTNKAGYSASVKVTMNLANVDDKTFQQIADENWAKFKSGLEGLGFKIIDPSEYADNENWKKLVEKDKGEVKPIDFFGGEFVMVTPKGMPAYTYPGEEGALSVFGAFNLSSRSDILEQNLAKDLDKAIVLTPTFVIDFAKCYKSGGTFSDTAAAQCKPVMTLRHNTTTKFANMTKMDSFLGAQSAAGQINLTRNIETSESFGGVQKVDSDSTEIYIPYYSYTSSSSSVYAVVADAGRYKEVAGKVIGAGIDLTLATIKEEMD